MSSASNPRALQVGDLEYFEEAFDLRYAKKREVLEALVKMVPSLRPKGAVPPGCFISYAWPEKGHSNYEEQKYHAHWVERLAELLKLAGLHVFFDKWEDKVGKRASKFVRELTDASVFVLVIGTRLYAEKCRRAAVDAHSEEHVVAFENRIIEGKLEASEVRGERIFPILLEGKKEESFPALLNSLRKIPCDFVGGDYFEGVLKLVLDLYGINGSTPEAQALTQVLHVLSSFIEKEATDEKREHYRSLTIEEKLKLQLELKKWVNMDSLTPQHSPRHGAMAAMLERVTAQFSRPGFSPGSGLLPAQDTGVSSASAASPPSSVAPLLEFSCLGPWRESVLKNEEVTRELELYIPLRASSSPHDKSSSDLVMQVMAFLEDQEAQVLLLLGGSGSGKSSFGQYLEQELWHKPELAKGRIPLWINLPGLTNPQHEAIEEAFRQKMVPLAEIRRLKQEKTFLFILDGYDEIRASGNLYVSNRLGEWKAKVIVTCRQEYFMTDPAGYRYQFMPMKGQKPVPAGLWERYVSPFSKDDVHHYLQEYIKIKQSEWPLSRYLEQIEELPELKELIETPFLLRITAEVLPKVVKGHEQDKEAPKLTRLALYEAFVTEWFERHLAKYMQDSSIGVLGANPMDTLGNFSERLAVKMHEAGVDAVQYEKSKPSPWAEFFKDEPEVNLMRRACPLKKAGASHHAFIHRSLLEYFLTPSLLKGIHSVKGNGKDEVPAVAPPVSADLEMLNRKLLNSEPSVIHFLVDAVRSNPSLKDKLFAILEASKRDEKVATAAANAATILNAARASFVGRDLRGVRLSGADLSHGIYDSTNFEGADLRNVGLRGAWLHRANFQNAQMQGAQFGEYPSLSFNGWVRSCCYSPDGRWLAVACGEVIEILDAVTRKKRWSLTGHTGSVTNVAFSPDGRTVASGSDDRTVRLWDFARGEPLLKPLTGHTHLVTSVAFSPDGKSLASGSRDKTLRLWDVERGEPLLKPLVGHMGYVTSVAFSPDGKSLASGSGDKTVRLWDVERGEPLLKPLEGHTGSVWSVAFSPDGRKVVSGGGDKAVRLWDLARGVALLKPLEGHTGTVRSVAFSPDGRKVVSGGGDKAVRLWDVERGEPLLKPLEGHTDSVGSVAFSPDGRRVVSGSYDQTVRLWDIERGVAFLKPLEGHTNWVTSVAFSPDGRKVVSGSYDGTVRLWDVERGEALLKPFEGHTDWVRSVAFSPDGRKVASGSDDKTVRLWDVERGEPLLKPLEGHTGWVMSVAFSPDGKSLASGSDDQTVRLWDLARGEPLLKPLEGHTDLVRRVAFSPDGKSLASGSDDKSVRLWDIERGEPLLKPLEGHTDTVWSVAFSPDGGLIVSVGLDGILMVHDSRVGEICDLVHTFGAIYSVAWGHSIHPAAGPSNNGVTALVTGHSDTSVRCWHWKGGHLSLAWTSHQGTLVLDKANIEGAQLSRENAELLRERGAVGGSSMMVDRHESKNETESLREVVPVSSATFNRLSVASSSNALSASPVLTRQPSNSSKRNGCRIA